MHGGVANFIHKLNSYIDNISASVFVSVGGRMGSMFTLHFDTFSGRGWRCGAL